MPSRLRKRFDVQTTGQGYVCRSEAIRDLVRDRRVEADRERDKGTMSGVGAMVYDHEIRMTGDRLTDRQHRLGHLLVSTLHVHLDARDCLEVPMMSGLGDEVRELADRRLSLQGVKHGRLVITGMAEEARQ